MYLERGLQVGFVILGSGEGIGVIVWSSFLVTINGHWTVPLIVPDLAPEAKKH